MNIDEFNNKIVILNDNDKNNFINSINKLINVKVITLSELKKKYFFDYTKEAICFISNKYEIKPQIAQKYIDNIYYIQDINNEKINFLKNIKEDLINNKLLIENKLFKNYLINKDIILYNLKYVDKFYLKIIKSLKEKNNVEEYNIENNKTKKELYKANNKEEEIAFIASKICELIKLGIDINNIKLSNVQKDYYFELIKTFNLFNIPLEINKSNTIKGTTIVKKFKESFNNDIYSVIEELSLNSTNEEKQILNEIVNIINEYSFTTNYESVKEMIFDDIDKISLKEKYNNVVKIVDFDSNLIFSNDYIFLVNFNEGIIPINIKDEDYLSDKLKSKLDLSTSYDLNKNNILKIKEIIEKTKNLIVTCSTHDISNELYISSAYDKNLFIEKDIKQTYKHSNNYNKLKLVSLKDEYIKYGSVNEDLVLLNSKYKEDYLCFDNKYKKIDKSSMKEYMKNGLTLSYSSMDTYYRCSFKYYLDNILRINKYEDTFEIVIGNIFHKILSECFNDNYNFESGYNEVLKNTNYEFNSYEKYFLFKLKKELILIIETIKNQLKYTSLSKSMYEKEIIVNVNSELNVKFKGFIDKILYDEIDNRKVVAIIDYKTGNPNLNINNVPYGLEMQLPIYIYLIKNEIKDVIVGGFYLQKILNNITDEEKRIESLKLQGYSNSNEDILKLVDSSYENSKVIKSLKVGNNGFYAYSKIISNDEIDKLYNMVENKINEASKNILDANFDINPKEIANKNIGCSFCKYKDICYMKNKDIVKLKEIKNVLGDDNNANMD